MYVSVGCPAEDADGSAAHPFPAIEQAIAAAEAENAILVAPGTYTENVIIDKTLSIIGTTGSDRGETAGIVLQAPNPNTITILGAKDVFLQGFRVVDAKEAGIVVRGGSLKVDNSSVSDTVALTDGLGYGVAVRDSGSLVLQNSTITHSQSTGVLLFGSHGIVLQSTISDNEGGGVRIDRSDKGSIVQYSSLRNNAGFGVSVFGAKASILNNEIVDVRMGASELEEIGDGIIVSGVTDPGVPTMIASVEVNDNDITNVDRVGALLAVDTQNITLQNNQIQGSGKEAGFGAGIWMQQGAGGDLKSNKIQDNVIKDNKFVGIGMTGEQTSVALQNNDISGTTMGTTFVESVSMDVGDGIGVFLSARAQITGNRVNSCARIGIVLDRVNHETAVVDNRIERNDFGVVQQNQSALDVVDNTIQLNTSQDERVVGVNEAPMPVRSDDFEL